MSTALPPTSRDLQLWISDGRYESYLNAAGGDHGKAVLLYEWNARLASACFEVFHFVEVVARNAMDRELRLGYNEASNQIPWFLLLVTPIRKLQERIDDDVNLVRTRLRPQARETRDQIVAGLSFGFWTNLLHSDHDDLWIRHLHKAFPKSSGRRKDVIAVMEPLRVFRNRIAHHDSLLGVDVRFRLVQMLQVLSWIDPAAEDWLRGIERITEIVAARPVPRKDTVVVAARNAWSLYTQVGAYVCQPGRSFQTVEHLAFYADREIKPEVPAIRRRRDNILWTAAELARLRSSVDPDDRRLAQIIAVSRTLGWNEGRYQVFDLTSAGDEGHRQLKAAVPNLATGRGSAFTQSQRYVVLADLRKAKSTADL